ncbi:MAG: peptidoglycan DD-metalloendopeptidase family protein [Deltaproteobacteria bacterium]|nr:peptidoglycan DD-metalloendopeptidase family protein [Deltaproteobacteria bacterium]
MKRSSQKHPAGCHLWRVLLLLYFGLLVVTATPSMAFRLSQKSKLSRIKQAISQQHEKVEKNTTKEFNVKQELKNLDKILGLEQKNLQAVQQNLSRQEKDLQKQRQKADIIIKEKNKQESHIKKRLAAFYKMGGVTVINTLMAAKSMPDLLNLQEYFRDMFRYDKQNIERYITKLYLISEAGKNIEQNRNKLLKLIEQKKNQEQQLIKNRQQRKRLLAQIKTRKGLYQQALAEMRKNAFHLTRIINSHKIPVIHARLVKTRRRNRARKLVRSAPTGFAAQIGRLPVPVSGSISRYFGSQSGQFGLQTQSPGWDFVTDKNIAIRAIYAGKIIFSTRMDGYGKVLIIDHGQQYYTLLAGIGRFLKVKGDSVKAGDTIGYTSAAGSPAPKLHFEIRHRSRPLDPMLWIDKSQSNPTK